MTRLKVGCRSPVASGVINGLPTVASREGWCSRQGSHLHWRRSQRRASASWATRAKWRPWPDLHRLMFQLERLAARAASRSRAWKMVLPPGLAPGLRPHPGLNGYKPFVLLYTTGGKWRSAVDLHHIPQDGTLRLANAPGALVRLTLQKPKGEVRLKPS